MKQEYDYDEIEAFLQGKLDEGTSKAIEQKTRQEDAFASEIAIHKDIFDTFKDQEAIDFKNKLNKLRQGLDAQRIEALTAKIKPLQPKQRTRSFRQLLSLAASVLILVVAGVAIYLSQSNASPSALYGKYADLPNNLGDGIRGEEDLSSLETQLNETWKNANESYEQGDYEAALNSLEQIPSIDPNFDIQSRGGYYYHLGLIYLKSEQPRQAIEAFEQVQGSSFDSDAQWYKALSLLLTENDVEQAKAEFQELISDNHPKSDAAAAILKQLK